MRFIKSFFTGEEVVVRLTPSLENLICTMAGTRKFAKALPNLEIAVRAVIELCNDSKRGCKIYEVDKHGEKAILNLIFGEESHTADFPEECRNEKATSRIRITKDLQDKIIELAEVLGAKPKTGDKVSFNETLPYLYSAINMISMLRQSQEEGSKFFLTEPQENGETERYRLTFI